MDPLSGIILGIIQGLTEFLPISSSGHLIIAREFFGVESAFDLSFDAVLQLATSLTVLVYFRKDFLRIAKLPFAYIRKQVIKREDKILLGALVLGTIPAVVFGLLLEDTMETVFRSAELVAWTLLAGSLIFYLAEKFAKQESVLTEKKGLWIGFFQVLALIPGMSRSGMTISGGLFMGLTRENAARFSFLLSFPIIFGSGMKKLLELGFGGAFNELGISLFLGAVSAFIVGMLAIHYLLKYLKNHSLSVFIWYRVILAAIIFATLV